MPLDYPNPELRTAVVHLRKWTMGDLGCVEAASTDPEIPRGTTVPAQYTEGEGMAWIERNWSRQTSGQGLSLAIADPTTDEAKGLVYLGLGRIEGHCRLGYWLIPGARRRGMGTAAIRLVSRWVLTGTGVYRLVAHVEPHNTPSIALLRKCGFTEEGLLRSYLRFDDGVFDALSFSLLAGDLDRLAEDGIAVRGAAAAEGSQFELSCTLMPRSGRAIGCSHETRLAFGPHAGTARI